MIIIIIIMIIIMNILLYWLLVRRRTAEIDMTVKENCKVLRGRPIKGRAEVVLFLAIR